jgi:hypothetical protein
MVGTLVRGSMKVRLAAGAAHVAAAAAVAGGFGFLLAEAGGRVPGMASSVTLVVLTAAYLGAELGIWSMPVPETGRQVPSEWRYRYPAPVTAALYGGSLAPGLGTRVPFPSFVVVLGASSLGGSLVSGVTIMGTYGLMRAVMAVVVANLSKVSPSINIDIGYQYRWILKFLIIATVAMYFGGCGAALARFL